MIKFRLILVVWVSLLVLHLVTADILEKWQRFREKHNKRYKNREEERRKYSIFQQNAKRAENHNLKYMEGKSSYKVKTYSFSDTAQSRKTLMTDYEMKRQRDKPKFKVPRPGNKFRAFSLAEKPPECVDWKKENKVTPSIDQGTCASCYSMASTGAIESMIAIKYETAPLHLSSQLLIDCTKDFGNAGCKGGLPDNDYQFIMDRGGLLPESAYPYTGKEGPCPKVKKDAGFKITDYYQIGTGDEEAMKHAVWKYGPVSCGMNASPWSFHHYAGGIYDNPNCTSDKLDHSVLVVGYCTEGGTDYWIVKNSWGDEWGEEGFFRLKRNVNLCGIANISSYPVL